MPKAANAFSFDMFDTKTLAEKGVEVEIIQINGEPSGLFITVLGTDGSTAKKLQDKFTREKNHHNAKYGLGKRAELMQALVEDQIYSFVAECTLSWRHVSGEPMPFEVTDKDKLIEFYKQYPIVYDQAWKAIVDRENFIKR